MVLWVIGVFAVLGLATWLRPWPLFPMTKTESRGLANDEDVAKTFRQWVAGQALIRGLNVRGVARAVSLECPNCRKASNYFIYPDEICERCWRARLKSGSVPASGNRA